MATRATTASPFVIPPQTPGTVGRTDEPALVGVVADGVMDLRAAQASCPEAGADFDSP